MPSTVYPTLTLQLSTAPPASAPTWQTVPQDRLIAGTYKHGRQFELDRVEAGTAEFLVLNNDRRFDPTFTTGPYYPSLLPLRRVRLLGEWLGVTTSLWDGYLESIDQVWPAKGAQVAFATLKCTDGFEIMARRILVPTIATVTTSTGVTNGDLTFTTRGTGGVQEGNPPGIHGYGYGWAGHHGPATSGGEGPVSVQYVSGGSTPPISAHNVTVSGTAITVQLQQATGQAENIMNALNANAGSSSLISTRLAPGSTGKGMVGPYGPVTLVGEFVSERSDLRVARVLDKIAWSGTDRALRTGAVSVQTTNFQASDNMTALQHMQDVTATELGILYMDGQNRAVFLDRNHRNVSPYNTVQAVYTDNPVGPFFYTDLQPAYDSRYLFNKVTVTRNGGIAQTVSDATSITNYLTRELNLSTIGTTDAASFQMATAVLARYKTLKMRYDSITVQPPAGSGMWAHVLGFDISTRINVRRTPPGGSAQWNQDCYIEAASHSFNRHASSWQTQWQLSPA